MSIIHTTQVHTPPSIAMAQKSFAIVQGGSLVLECKAKGKPQPRIQWFLNDEKLVDANVDEEGSLLLDEIYQEHQGTYKCVAENELGLAERLVSVVVNRAPVIEGAGLVKANGKPEEQFKPFFSLVRLWQTKLAGWN